MRGINISVYFVMGIVVICLIIKLARQLKETIYVRRIIKPDDYEKKMILKSNYIHIILYSIFVLAYILNILFSLNFINATFITTEAINFISILSILVFLIGEFIIIPKINSNIRF